LIIFAAYTTPRPYEPLYGSTTLVVFPACGLSTSTFPAHFADRPACRRVRGCCSAVSTRPSNCCAIHAARWQKSRPIAALPTRVTSRACSPGQSVPAPVSGGAPVAADAASDLRGARSLSLGRQDESRLALAGLNLCAVPAGRHPAGGLVLDAGHSRLIELCVNDLKT